MITREKFDELFKRIELDKLTDKCGFEFADGWNCTFENIANCYDDRLELYEQVKKQQQVIDKAIEYILECSINEKGHINVSLSSEEVGKLLDILEECYNE